ncbi:MAG: bifunctional folylpolyglutamate synthase/dihydrofolate synthase [Lentisphaeraceae bacterium]|nr:bifunctional folylpolyglutamate synthase/dihydrofolate synthase [Lentisphaeraceae bacterium]
MTYKEVHEYLDSLLVFGIKLGLENMEALCRLLNHPEKSLQFIHVAGTNGKGSSCSMIAAAMKNCGLKTGFYSSPFLYRFTERWRVNGCEVTEEQITDAIEKISAIEPELISVTGVKPTYFEVLTAAAMLIFKEAGVDVVVWETGMGGRLDATNVVTPLVSLITNIELDHTQYLGDTLEAIAFEKGGIVKKDVPFICGDTKPEIVEVMKGISEERGSKLYLRMTDFTVNDSGIVRKDDAFYRDVQYKAIDGAEYSIKLPALGKFQVENSASVLAALEIVCTKLALSFDDACRGVEKFIWPGRMERRNDGLVLDGAHNPVGAKALVETLEEMYPGESVHFVCGILSDKSWQEVLDVLNAKAESYYFVEVAHVRTSQAETLSEYASKAGKKVLGSGSSKQALAEIKRPDRTVVVGSLYLIGEVLSLLNNKEPAQIDSL